MRAWTSPAPTESETPRRISASSTGDVEVLGSRAPGRVMRAIVIPTIPVVEISGNRRQAGRREAQREVAGGVGPPLGRAEAGGGQLGLDPRPPELGADLGAHLLAGGELHLEVEGLDPHRAARAAARSRISIHSSSRSEAGDVRERVGVEVGVELAVHDVQHVAVELGGDAGGVVVGGDEPVDVLHEVGAEQERVAGAEPGRELGEERGARRRREVADRAAEERDQAAAAGGQRAEVALEVADDGVHATRRTRRRLPPAASRSVASLTSNGTNRRSVPRVAERVEQEPRLLRRARAELDERVGAACAPRSRRRGARGSPARRASGSTRAGG